MKYLISVLIFLGITNCVTTPPKSEPVGPSIEQIKERLQMLRHIDDVGFAEKAFDECDLGFSTENCVKEYLTIIHFQLLCRDSEGTVGVAPKPIPIQSNVIKWKVGDLTGVTATDASGYGKIEFRSARSSAKSRLRLTIEDRFLAVPAAEISRVVAPGDWCP